MARFFYGGPQLSRQNQKPHGKTENLTAKTKTSRQNQKAHGKNKDLTAKPNTSQEKPNTLRTAKANTHGKTKAILLLLWSIWFCPDVFCFYCEVFGFAVTVVGHHRPPPDLPSLMSLTIVGPVSRSHELATDFLHFLKKVKLQKIL